MTPQTSEYYRNILLAGHASSGKTTLAEQLLHQAGTLETLGSVEKGNTLSDFDPLEIKHHHSLRNAYLSFTHGEHTINLMDSPGYPDLCGHALAAMDGSDAVIVVVNAQSGVEGMTRKLLNWASQCAQARMIVINKIDQPDLQLEALIEQIQEIFGDHCLPLNLPAKGSAEVLDCLHGAGTGETEFSSVELAHTAILDQVVELDDSLLEEYLEKGSISADKRQTLLNQAIQQDHLLPILFTSAQSGAGVTALLDALVNILPSPMQAKPHPFRQENAEETQEFHLECDSELPVLAHVVNLNYDPFMGKIAVLRLHQGRLNKNTPLYIDDARKPQSFPHLFALQGKNHLPLEDELLPGAIFAVAKVEALSPGSIVLDQIAEESISKQPPPYPSPMVGVVITARNRGDEQKVIESLHKITNEDPCLSLQRDSSTNENVLRGMGDLHLRLVLERLEEQYKVEVDTATPAIPYRESIRKSAEGHCRHKKQTGGAGQFAEVYLKVTPQPRGAGFAFVNNIVGGVIPIQLIPAVEKGVRQVLDSGAFAGFPVVDLQVSVYDGKFHPVDSKEVAFVSAGKKAFIDAVSKARPIILEPIMAITIELPSANMGDVASDLSTRRGRINNTDANADGHTVISGHVPLSEMDSYQSKLNSMTGGEASYEMEFFSYEAVTAEVQKQLSENFQHPEED